MDDIQHPSPDEASSTAESQPIPESVASPAMYQVRLEEFEGPLDLLLHLIKKNELDISTISVSLITEQYLQFIDMMKQLNLEVAGEYLVMAATLAHMKSKSLLPDDDESCEEDALDGEDNEEALIRRLMEYKTFKEVGEEFRGMPWEGREFFLHVNSDLEQIPSRELKPVSLFTLVEILYKRLQKMPKILEHEVVLERITVAQRIQELVEGLNQRNDEAVDFYEAVGDIQSRHEVVVTFLALLEMCRCNMVRIVQADSFGQILIKKQNLSPTTEASHAFDDSYSG